MKGRRLIVTLGIAILVIFGCISCKSQSVRCPTPTESAEHEEEKEEEKEGLEGASSYEEVYQLLNHIAENMKSDGIWYEEKYSIEDSVSSGTTDSAAVSSANDYGETNVQVEDIDEGDLIKNDGSYLYFLDSQYGEKNVIRIVDVRNTKMKEAAEIKMDSEDMVTELYCYQDLLIILYNTYVESREGRFTNIVCYDISEPANPKKCESFQQEGSSISSRITDEYLYIVSCKENVFTYNENSANYTCEDNSIPYVNECEQSYGKIYLTGEEDNTCFMTVSSLSCFMTVSSLSLDELGKKSGKTEAKDSFSVLVNAENFYMSETSIYITEESLTDKERITKIRRFSYEDGMMEGEAEGEVPGSILDTFAFNESDNYVRIVTTSYQYSQNNNSLTDTLTTENSTNGLYILDMNLQQTGCIEDIASGESVKSARFMGDVGYFVTFRQIDPLFSIDLSDPKNPKIIGELKIPGFSEYLHFYSDDLLLGIGVNVEDDENSSSGLKLSMFDISNPAEVKEVAKLVLPDYDYSNGLYNYKEVLINTEKNIIGFEAEGYSNASYAFDYLLFSYDEENKKFVMEQQIEHTDEDIWIIRGTYAGDTLFVIENYNTIDSYSLITKKKLDEISM